MPQPFLIVTPLPADLLALESFSCTEGLSELTEITAVAVGPRPDLDSNAMLGQPAHIEMGLRDGATRYLRGYISHFSQSGVVDGKFRYEVVIRPWLWFLSLTVDCRVFQNLTVPEIIQQVFNDHEIASSTINLFRHYPVREYCVQYRESDLAFVSRLLEEEGIYFSFEDTEDAHCAVFNDSNSAHDQLDHGYDTLPLFAAGDTDAQGRDCVTEWTWGRKVSTNTVTLTDFDYRQVNLPMEVEAIFSRHYKLSDYEVFDFPGGYTNADDGSQYASNRLNELQTRFETFSGASNAHGIQVAKTFSLTRNPRADQATSKFLIVRNVMTGRNGTLSAGDGAKDGAAFQCRFSAIDSLQQFRPQRRTEKPFVRGPQTAFVVGGDAKEIDADEAGRIRVQFHWDRYGNRDDNSSCAIRVAQIWAGKSFGAVFLPRVGHEVIVDFLEGDPDRPIVTGSVYNSVNQPPWSGKDQASVSGIVSRSTPHGNVKNANSIRFDDKKGAEKLALHAELNMSTSVEYDQSLTVGHDRTSTIENHDKTRIKGGSTLIVTASFDDPKAIAEDRQYDGNRQTSVTGREHRTINLGYTEEVSKVSNSLVRGLRIQDTEGDFNATATNHISKIDKLLQTRAEDTASFSLKRHYIQADEQLSINAKNLAIETQKDTTAHVRGNFERTVVGAVHEITHGAREMKNDAGFSVVTAGLRREEADDLYLRSYKATLLADLYMETVAVKIGAALVNTSLSGIAIHHGVLQNFMGGSPSAGSAAAPAAAASSATAATVSEVAASAAPEVASEVAPEAAAVATEGAEAGAPAAPSALELLKAYANLRAAAAAGAVTAVGEVGAETLAAAGGEAGSTAAGAASASEPVVAEGAAQAGDALSGLQPAEGIPAGTPAPGTLLELIPDAPDAADVPGAPDSGVDPMGATGPAGGATPPGSPQIGSYGEMLDFGKNG